MPVSSLLINFLLLLMVGSGVQKAGWKLKGLPTVLRVILFSSSIWLIFTAVGYLFSPLFFDHVEGNIASVAAAWWRGSEMYTDVDSPYRYSLLYGPWTYMVTAVFQLLGSSTILLSKLPGVLNLFLLLIGFAALLWRLPISIKDKMVSFGIVPMALLGFYNISYWNRPDSYLMSYAFISLLMVLNVEKVGSWICYLGIAILAGLACNCKAHGILYFLPIVVYFAETQRKHLSAVKLAVATALFACTFILPFLVGSVGEDHYLDWLKMASKHGLVFKTFVANVTFILGFIIPLALLGFYRKHPWTFTATGVGALLVAIAASKPGAGFSHFLPFVPVLLWWMLQSYFELSNEDRKKASLIVVAFVLTGGLNALNRQKRIANLFMETPERISELADIRHISSTYPGNVAMGVSGNGTYESSFYGVVFVARGGSLLLDAPALMDMEAAGLDIPDSTIEKIKACEVQYFVFPQGEEPWSMRSFYEEKPLFSEKFRSAFSQAYEFREKTKHFDIYQCVGM